MAALTRKEVLQRTASAVGCTEAEVVSVLAALARLARDEIHQGFLLPEFGELRVSPGPPREIRNPATGELMTIPGDPQIDFVADSDVASSLLARRPTAQSAPARAENAKVLPEIRLHLERADLEAAGIEADSAEHCVSKLGGAPDWVQAPPEHVVCCSQEMTFYGQLDSDFDARFNIGDAGRIFVFLCEACGKATTLVQYF